MILSLACCGLQGPAVWINSAFLGCNLMISPTILMSPALNEIYADDGANTNFRSTLKKASKNPCGALPYVSNACTVRNAMHVLIGHFRIQPSEGFKCYSLPSEYLSIRFCLSLLCISCISSSQLWAAKIA